MNDLLCKPLALLVLCIFSICTNAQFTITGDFPPLAGHQVRLVGFEGFGISAIDSTTVSEKGQIALRYTPVDRGMGYLAAEDNKSFFVILGGEDIELRGESLAFAETIEILNGKENQLFEQYAIEHPRREQTLSAWIYLQKIYMADPLFAAQENSQEAIETEIQRIRKEDKDFLSNLPRGSFVSWYLPIRKLISSVSIVAQYRSEEIPETIAAFRALDYADERFYKSGLLSDAIESHFWLIENSGRALDSVFVEMKISIDHLLENLLTEEAKFNLITNHLFNLLEKRSLFEASEYLALKVLNETSCTINNDLAAHLESYRAMKKGNTAPDIVFTRDIFKNGTVIKIPNRLSEVLATYKVVVFGAGWCPKCAEELSQVSQLYQKWKSKGVEVVFVSLDTDAISYQNLTRTFPFISICDYKKWETPAAKDYYVFATPTFFLLDSNQKIILRPNSVGQIDAWVDFYIAK